jgi:hypothetical protein
MTMNAILQECMDAIRDAGALIPVDTEDYQQGYEAGYARGWNDAIASDGVYGAAPDPSDTRPLRRIAYVHEVWGDDARCYPQLSCGHTGPDARSKRSIEKGHNRTAAHAL